MTRMRALSSLLEVAGVALVAFGFGLRWFWVGIVVAGVGLAAIGVLLDLGSRPVEQPRRDG